MKTIASITAAITFALLYTASAQEKGFPEIGASYYFSFALETPRELRVSKLKIIEKGEAQWYLVEYQPNPPKGEQSNEVGDNTSAQTPALRRIWLNLAHVQTARKVIE